MLALAQERFVEDMFSHERLVTLALFEKAFVNDAFVRQLIDVTDRLVMQAFKMLTDAKEQLPMVANENIFVVRVKQNKRYKETDRLYFQTCFIFYPKK